MVAKGRRKAKSASRRKKFVVYGRFLSAAGTQIEMYHTDARSMAVALRKAIPILWKRPAVKWRHHSYVNFSCQPQDSREAQ